MDIPEYEIIIDDISTTIKVDRRKLIRAPHRYRPDGTYDINPISPTYYKDYYNNHKETTECQHCHKFYTHKNGLYKHLIRSNKCLKLRTTQPNAENI